MSSLEARDGQSEQRFTLISARRWYGHRVRRVQEELFALYVALIHRWNGIEGIAHLLSKTPSRNVRRVLVRYGASIDEGTTFYSPLYVQNMVSGDLSNLRVGKHCYIGKRVLFDMVEPIELQDETVLSANVSIFTHADPGERLLRQFYPRRTGSVTIGVGTWLGAGSTVLHSVTIGQCCVVGAGAVVTEDLPSYSVAVGVPARVVKVLQ